MKMLKRVAAGLAAAVLALGMLTACGSEKGTPQSWIGSNLGKVINPETTANSRILLDYTVVEGEDTGTRKYAIGTHGYSKEGFVGSKDHGWLSGADTMYDHIYPRGKIVDHNSRTYQEFTGSKVNDASTLYQGTADEYMLWYMFGAGKLTIGGSFTSQKVVMTNEEKYKGKMYHTESFALLNGGAGEYTYTFYYESKDADKPAYLRIESLSKSCMLKVNEFKAVAESELGEYAFLLSTTGYRKQT